MESGKFSGVAWTKLLGDIFGNTARSAVTVFKICMKLFGRSVTAAPFPPPFAQFLFPIIAPLEQCFEFLHQRSHFESPLVSSTILATYTQRHTSYADCHSGLDPESSAGLDPRLRGDDVVCNDVWRSVYLSRIALRFIRAAMLRCFFSCVEHSA